MPAIYTCDICGKDAEGEDYEGNILCKLHKIESELKRKESEYEEQKKWVSKIWITKLKEAKTVIKTLKSKIEELKEEERRANNRHKITSREA